MKEEKIEPALIQHRLEKEEKSREKIKEYFITGQMNPKVAFFSLRLLGITSKKAKEIIEQWSSKKPVLNEIKTCQKAENL